VNPAWLLQNVLQKAITLVHYFDHIATFIAYFQVVPSVVHHKRCVSIQGLPSPIPISVPPPYHPTFIAHTDSFLQFSLTLAFSSHILIFLLTTNFYVLLTYSSLLSLLEGLLHKLTQRSFFKCLTSFYLDIYAQTVCEETSGFLALSSLLTPTSYFVLYWDNRFPGGWSGFISPLKHS